MIDIKVPTVGESISEVTLVKWLKSDGQICQSWRSNRRARKWKSYFEVNAEQAGTLQTVGKEGDTLKIGMWLQELMNLLHNLLPQLRAMARKLTKKESEKPKQEASVAKEVTAAAVPVQSSANDIKATLLQQQSSPTKKMDASSIMPSGIGGKIIKHDVLEALANPGRVPGKSLFSRELKKEKMEQSP